MEPHRSPYRRKFPEEKKTSGTKRFVITALLLLLLVGTIAGAIYGWRAWVYRAKLRDLQLQFASLFEEGNGPDGGDRDRFRDLRKQADELPDAYRRELRRGMRDMFRSRQEQNMRDYLAMDKDARRKQLDRQIAEGERRAKEREARRKERAEKAAKEGTAASGNGNGSGGRGDGQGGQGSGQNGQGQGGPGQGGPGGGGGRMGGGPPEMRAMRAEYSVDMRQRRTELGLPPLRHGGWGRR